MGPGDLEQVLKALPALVNKELLVGLETRDDAAVFQMDGRALVQTVDFFTPIVDDPYLFGQIAAANALSDVYAMGGTPLTALNLAAFPCALDLGILAEILRGGRDKIEEAGAIVVGGHTVEDNEPKYGLAVTGVVDPAEMVTVSAGRAGDRLILTKPLGVGILSTALKNDLVTERDIKEAIDGMCALNDVAAREMKKVGVKAATDVTGFGLLGHLHTLTSMSGLGGVVEVASLPLWPRTRELAEQGVSPGGAAKNRDYLRDFVSFEASVDKATRAILFDPQTSGGLLIAAPDGRAEDLVGLLEAEGITAAVIGELADGRAGEITVRG